MKIRTFNITKYQNGMRKLEARKAPTYVIDAYKDGYVGVINAYYAEKLKNLRSNKQLIVERKDVPMLVALSENKYINEALKNQDYTFIKLFYQLTNMDILTGNKMPPDLGKYIKAGAKNINLNDLFKKMK